MARLLVCGVLLLAFLCIVYCEDHQVRRPAPIGTHGKKRVKDDEGRVIVKGQKKKQDSEGKKALGYGGGGKRGRESSEEDYSDYYDDDYYYYYYYWYDFWDTWEDYFNWFCDYYGNWNDYWDYDYGSTTMSSMGWWDDGSTTMSSMGWWDYGSTTMSSMGWWDFGSTTMSSIGWWDRLWSTKDGDSGAWRDRKTTAKFSSPRPRTTPYPYARSSTTDVSRSPAPHSERLADESSHLKSFTKWKVITAASVSFAVLVVIVAAVLLSMYFCKKNNRGASAARVGAYTMDDEKIERPPSYTPDVDEKNDGAPPVVYPVVPGVHPGAAPMVMSMPPTYSSINLRQGDEHMARVITVQPAVAVNHTYDLPKY